MLKIKSFKRLPSQVAVHFSFLRYNANLAIKKLFNFRVQTYENLRVKVQMKYGWTLKR